MTPEDLKTILEKAVDECKVESVSLFNWGEPLLHPQLPALVRIVKTFGLPCYISTNLNVSRNYDELLEANPDRVMVSCSGFHNWNYELFHRRGNIEKLKCNMKELASAKSRTVCNTLIEIRYHRYLGNLDDEVEMRKLARHLNFDFTATWAYLMDVEKLLRSLNDPLGSLGLKDDDAYIQKKLCAPIRDYLTVCMPYRKSKCVIRERQVSINCTGVVQLCCMAYDENKYSIGDFLSMSLDEIQAKKRDFPLCRECMEAGLHIFLCNLSPEIHYVAAESICQSYIQVGVGFLRPMRPSRLHSILQRSATKAWLVLGGLSWAVALYRRYPRLFRPIAKYFGLHFGRFSVPPEY